MSNIFKSFSFWKKFTKFFTLGICLCIILAGFNQSSFKVLADFTCPSPIQGLTISNPASNQSLPYNTTSVNLSWNAPSNAQSYTITVNNSTTGASIYSNDNYQGTSVLISPLVNGNFYRALIIPRNNCGSGASNEVAFSVGTGPQNCSGIPSVTCSDGAIVDPDPNNNCQTVCPGQPVGQLTCGITLQRLNQASNGYQFSLAGQAISPNASINSYGWDFTDDGDIDAYGQTVQQPFYADTTVRLHVTDTLSRFGDCYARIVLPTGGNTGSTPSCNISASPQSGQAPLFVNFSSSAQANNGGYITGYKWDLNGDGAYNDSFSQYASYTYNYLTHVALQVVDNNQNVGYCYTDININNNGGVCTTDLFRCPDGSYVGRNQNNSCEFFACPSTGNNCGTGTMQCPDGSYVGKNPSTCQFYACPNNGNTCRTTICPAAPAGCFYQNQVTYSCDPNVALSCGTLAGSCLGNDIPVSTPDNGIDIINNNTSSSSSSSSSSSNNNNINNVVVR